MSSYCFDDKREKSTRGMAQQCQNRMTLAWTSRPPAGRLLAARPVLPGSLVDAPLGEVEQPILALVGCEVHPDPSMHPLGHDQNILPAESGRALYPLQPGELCTQIIRSSADGQKATARHYTSRRLIRVHYDVAERRPSPRR
jgi:hypothetical protein